MTRLKTPPNAQRNWERKAAEMRTGVELRGELERKHGLSDHPKAGLLWTLAWEHGHADGLRMVAEFYDDMAELLK